MSLIDNFDRGVFLEKYWSERVHRNDLPLLISAKFLRDRGCGQVDLACISFSKDLIVLYEVKASMRMKFVQKYRLQKTSRLLAHLFEKSVIINFLFCNNSKF